MPKLRKYPELDSVKDQIRGQNTSYRKFCSINRYSSGHSANKINGICFMKYP